MASRGNQRVGREYEQLVPVSYRRPRPNDPRVLLEEWIRAKYEREDFWDAGPSIQRPLVAPSTPLDRYQSGHREGYLSKRGRNDKQFRRRWFVLDKTENTLRYYNRRHTQEAKGTFRLDSLNVALVPQKVDHPNGMQFIHEGCDIRATRNIFVYAETGQEMVEWYSCIRWLKMQRLLKTHPGQLAADMLSSMLTRDFVKEGWLMKTGPPPYATYRRRWVTLEHRKLRYQKDPLDAFSMGEINLGTIEEGFSVQGTDPIRRRASTSSSLTSMFTFTLTTPQRCYCFAADTENDKQNWITVIEAAIDCSTNVSF
jgi:hypothetical protein